MRTLDLDTRTMARCFSLGILLTFGAGCVDPVRSDRALAEVEEVRRDAAEREATLRAMEARQEAMNQQMTMLMAMASSTLARDPRKDEERDRRISAISDKVDHVDAMVTRMREEEQPTPVDIAAARRAAEQGSDEERAASVRRVQALLDAGQVKVTVKNGRMQLSLLRPIDANDPYRAKPATGKQEKDKLKDLLDSR